LNTFLRKPCMVANWKMQGSFEKIEVFLGFLEKNPAILQGLDVIFCPPAVYLDAIRRNTLSQEALYTLKLAAQNTYCEQTGAFTGEISPGMLKEVGCQYVLLGHSERRHLLGEDDTLIARKVLAAYHAGLTPILCVGETAAERASGRTFEVISRQLEAVFQMLSWEMFKTGIIAYEPVWAIGTGVSSAPGDAEIVHAYIREWLSQYNESFARKLRILYGGSVKAENAKGLFTEENIDGALVGNASLQAEAFLNICQRAIDVAS
jgi:triosephosphate isomerase